MPFENAEYISDLNPADPLSNDPGNQGDDHLREIKLSLQANILGDVDATQLLVNNIIALAIERIGEFPILSMGGESLTGKLALGNLNGDDNVLLNNPIPGAIVGLQEEGKTKIATNTTGAFIFGDLDNDPATGGDQDVSVALRNSSGLSAGQLEYFQAIMRLNNRVLDGRMQLRATGGSGTVNLLTGDPNGEVALLWIGEERVVTKTAGVDFPGRTFDFGQQTDNSIIMRFINLIGGLRIIVSSVSGDPGINQVDNAGVFEQTWINFFRDAGLNLNAAGNTVVAVAVGGIVVTGQVTATAPVPLAGNQLTRLDYVQNWANGGAPAQLIQVQNMATQNGTVTPVGRNFSVTFGTPFTGNPSITLTIVNPTNANNGFAYLNTVSTTAFTGTTGFDNALVHWQAIGTLGRGL